MCWTPTFCGLLSIELCSRTMYTVQLCDIRELILPTDIVTQRVFTWIGCPSTSLPRSNQDQSGPSIRTGDEVSPFFSTTERRSDTFLITLTARLNSQRCLARTLTIYASTSASEIVPLSSESSVLSPPSSDRAAHSFPAFLIIMSLCRWESIKVNSHLLRLLLPSLG